MKVKLKAKLRIKKTVPHRVKVPLSNSRTFHYIRLGQLQLPLCSDLSEFCFVACTSIFASVVGGAEAWEAPPGAGVAAGGDDRLGQPAGHLSALGRSSMRQGAPCQVSIFKEKLVCCRDIVPVSPLYNIILSFSVAGCLSRIRIFPSRIQGQKDSGSASKNVSGSGSKFFSYLKGVKKAPDHGSWIRIRNTAKFTVLIGCIAFNLPVPLISLCSTCQREKV